MIADFKFFNVGQGCFYGGIIKHETQQFVLVYDCGTDSARKYLDDSIIEFRKEFKQIDLLIVSHLDSDHVNGIKDLIKGIVVNNIILPYLPLIDRLALAASKNNVDQDYINFLNNPVSYLQSELFNIEDIYFMNPEDVSDNEGNASNEPTKFNPSEIGEFILRGFNPDEEQKAKAILDDERLEDSLSLKFISFNTTLSLAKNLWEFVFYYRKVSLKGMSDFQKEVDKYMKLNSLTKLHELFDIHLNSIKKLYTKELKLSMNKTSICLYHGPLFNAHTKGVMNGRTMWYGKWWYPNKKRLHKFGTLLTGDQELKQLKDFDPFINHYLNKLKGIEVFQIPHHGSSANWNVMPNTLSNYDVGYYVINHGFGRKHHPNIKVVDNLKKNIKRVVVFNNELGYFSYLIFPN